MVDVEHVTMEFNLSRGKVRTLKELLFARSKKGNDENFKALNDVSFHLSPGDTMGIVGNNGAGKSTLLKVVSGIMKPSSGRAIVRGSVSPMIELGTGFDYELSAAENVYLSGAFLGYSRRTVREHFDEIFDFAELWDFKDVPIKYFSSGMVARLAFSISTIVKPDLLIVDEILSVGDVPFQKKSFARMKELMEGGATVLYVSHNLDSVEELCNRALWLEHGRVIMDGDGKTVCRAFKESIANG